MTDDIPRSENTPGGRGCDVDSYDLPSSRCPPFVPSKGM